MPITNVKQLVRMAAARGPADAGRVTARLEATGTTRAAVREEGVDITTELCAGAARRRARRASTSSR